MKVKVKVKVEERRGRLVYALSNPPPPPHIPPRMFWTEGSKRASSTGEVAGAELRGVEFGARGGLEGCDWLGQMEGK